MSYRNPLIIGLVVVVGLLLALLFEFQSLVATEKQKIDFQQFEQRANDMVRADQTKSEQLSSTLAYFKGDFGPHGRFRPVNWLRRYLFGQRWMYRWSPDEKWQPADALVERTINTQLKTIAILEKALGAEYAK